METLKTIGKVTAIKRDRNGLQLGGGDWYSGYVSEDVEKGCEIEIEFSKNGQWNNLKKIVVLKSENTGPTPNGNNNGMASYILSYTKDLVVADRITMEKFTDTCLGMVHSYKELIKELNKE